MDLHGTLAEMEKVLLDHFCLIFIGYKGECLGEIFVEISEEVGEVSIGYTDDSSILKRECGGFLCLRFGGSN